MSTFHKEAPSGRIQLYGNLALFRKALEDEIEKVKKSGQSSTLLSAGQCIGHSGADFWYRFNVEYLPAFPADTPCKLVIGKNQYNVTVVSFEGNSIIVSSNAPLPEPIGQARLENGATVLMERLIECIEDNADKMNPAGEHMLTPDKSIYQARKIFAYRENDLILKSSNTEQQNKAIKTALSSDITYIWGPPGTGKTTVIGQIIENLYKHNRSVLVVSHTNIAVDGAIDKAYKACCKTPENHNDDEDIYPILRLGKPAKDLNHRVLLDTHIKILGKELTARKDAIKKELDALRCRANELTSLLAKCAWVERNRLDRIRASSEAAAAWRIRCDEIQREIRTLEAAQQQEKDSHPEYTDFLTISRKLITLRSEYDSLCHAVCESENEVSDLSAQIESAQDEMKKHDKYAELRAEESKYMSSAFLRKEIAGITARLDALSSESDRLVSEQKAAQAVISDYERKNSLARFFSGKNAVVQAQKTLAAASIRIPEIQSELQRCGRLKQEYTAQLEDLLILQEQIKALTPLETREHWTSLLQQLQTRLSSTKSLLPELYSKKTQMYNELSCLEQQQLQAKAPFFRISEMSKQRSRVQTQLNDAKASCDQEMKRCSELLDAEYARCALFSQLPLLGSDDLRLNCLTEYLIAAKAETADIDPDALKAEKEDTASKLLQLSQELSDIEQAIKGLERQAIMSAKIVGTTLAKSYLSDVLRERTFDTVILDEASMASIPALWCASYLAENSLVIVGDFLQLPPIVMADTEDAQEWLGKDIFFHSGMQEAAKSPKTCPQNFVMLNDQFRMEPEIADIANMYYGAYGGLLSPEPSEERKGEEDEFYQYFPHEKPAHNIHLIDTESLHAWVTGVPQGKSHSRLNCFSAAVAVDLAFKFIEKKLSALDPATAGEESNIAFVLIVAPYKPHVMRINKLIELEYKNRGFKKNLKHIVAGTIHSFQGSEADVVIFDLVLDEPHWKANLFMTDRDINEDLKKMFNVAVTRAKFQLFVVGNFAYCQKRAKNNALSELLEMLLKTKALEKIDAKKLLPDIIFARQTAFVSNGSINAKHLICREDSFSEFLTADIRTFQNELIIYSPFITENRLSVLLPSFVDAINAGKKIIVVTKALSERRKNELARYKMCEAELRSIGVNIFHKKGMHEKLIFVDSKAIWTGSLNVLSFTGLTGEVMLRHEDKELAEEFKKQYNIEYICKAVANTYEQKCPLCDSEMIIKESSGGGIFWQCVTGDYSRDISQQYPVDGVLRCKCGAPYLFAMKNEPRWVCSEDPKHYQKMRETDLRFEKMAALIPTAKDRQAVERFFTQKK